MAKLSLDDKIQIYLERKKGITLSTLSKNYKVDMDYIKYIVRLIDRHGYDVLLIKNKNVYSDEFKLEVIKRVVNNNESIREVAIDVGLVTHSTVTKWVKNYKENGYNIVERKRGRSPTIMPKNNNKKKKETIEEEIERLKKENLYLKAELEYSKKLRAVVQARKNQQQKKK